MSPPPTGTHHPLPFGALSPADFERMCLWLVAREGYKRISDYGARGGPDGGRDFEGWRNGRRVLFQCKRTKTFSAADAKAEVRKVAALPIAKRPEELCFLLSQDPTPATIDAAKAAWPGDDSSCWFLSGRQLDERIRKYPEIVETFFALAPGGENHSVRIGGDAFKSPIVLGNGNVINYQDGRFQLVSEQYRCQAPHPGADFVHRGELDTMVERLTNSTDGTTTASTLAITTALQGAGGFGKTTLAQALCHHEEVQEAFPDGVLWVVMGEGLDDAGRIRATLDSLRAWIGANPPAFESAAAAGIHLRDLLNGCRVLVVVDDVWQRSDARPFEGLGAGSALLITTRNRDILPPGTLPLDVDEMESSEAVQLLGAGLGGQPKNFEPLARQLGEWPLLLRLVNGQLRKLIGRGVEVADALERVETKLRDRGLNAFNQRDAEAREDAVHLTMAAGFESGVLDKEDQARYRSLAIFPEDTEIPIEVLSAYWDLGLGDAEDLAERLFDLSLLQRLDPGPLTLRLHDVFRHYLIDEQRTQLAELNRKLLDAHRPESGRWADLLPSAGYLWRHLAHHLFEAGEASVLAELLVDPDYLQAKLQATDVNALLADFKEPAADPPRLLLADAIRKSAHCLSRDHNQLAGQLLGRVAESDRAIFQRLAESLRRRSGLLPRRGSLRPAGGPLKRTLEGHTSGILAVERLEGGRIVSASYDGTLRVWDVDSGKCLKTLEGHTNWVLAVERLEGGRIVSASHDRTLRLWDIESGECLHTLRGHTDVVRAAVRLDGGRIVSASDDRTLRVWNVESGKCLYTLQGHRSLVLAIERLEGECIASASDDRTLRVWDVGSGECLQTLRGHTVKVLAVQRLEGRRIVSASYDRTLRVWDIDSGECLQTLEGHTDVIRAVECLKDGRIVSASDDRSLRVWNVESGECLQTLEGHTDVVRAVECLEDGRIVSVSDDRSLRVWDAKSGECLNTLRGHTNEVLAIECLEDGRIVSASDDQTLRVWDPKVLIEDKGECLHTLAGDTAEVFAIRSLERRRIVSASSDRTLRVWNVESGECLNILRGHDGGVRAVEYLDGGRIVSASDDRTLRVWDVESGKCLRTLRGHTSGVRAVERLDRGQIVSASFDRTLRVWDIESGKCLRELRGQAFGTRGVGLLDRGRFVSASDDNAPKPVASRAATLRVWDVESGECLQTLRGHTGVIRGLKCLDGGWIASASDDQTLRVWDFESGECLQTLRGHTGVFQAIECLDGRRLASASDDQTLWVWDVETGECLRKLKGHTGVVRAVERLDGGRLVSASGRTVRVWDVESGECLRTLQGHISLVLAIGRLGRGQIVSASLDRTVRVWDVESAMCLQTLRGHTSWIRAVECLDDGRIVSASSDETLRVWDIESGKCLQTLRGHTGEVRTIKRLDGGRIVSMSSDKTIRVWDIESGECLQALGGQVFGMRVVERLDGGRIVSATDDIAPEPMVTNRATMLRVWDVEVGKCLQALGGHTDTVQAVECLDGERIVSASDDHTLRVWDVELGECLQTLAGHTGGVLAVERLDGGRIVSASSDKTLRVWDVESGECLNTLEGHSGGVLAVEYLDGGRIVSASSDNTLRVWDVESGSTVAVFTGEGPISAVTVITSNLIVAGDAAGRVHILDLVESDRLDEY